MRFNRALRAHIIVVSMSIAVFSSLITVPEGGSAYTPHSPITINGNADFVPTNGVVGGSGTPSDPFTIEGWEINASGAIGIDISNTDAHFWISNVYIHSGVWNIHSIDLRFVENGRIENTIITGVDFGIWLEDSRNMTISMNNVTSYNVYAISAWSSSNVTVETNNVSAADGVGIRLMDTDNSSIQWNYQSSGGNGIEVEYSDNVTIAGNTVLNDIDEWVDSGIRLGWSNNVTIKGNLVSYKNGSAMNIFDTYGTIIKNNTIIDSKYGVRLSDSANATVSNNTFTRNGLVLSGYRIYDYNSHTINTDNMVNGLPLYYHKDCTNLNVDGISVGQLIVVNCTGVIAKNLVIPDTDVSILMAFADDVLVSTNTLSGKWASIASFLSDEIHIEKNTIGDSMYGLTFGYSTNITIANNTVTKCERSGIDFMESRNIKVSGNSVSECGSGLRLERTDNPEVWQNTFSDNYYGIYLDDAGSTLVYHNNFISNTEQAWPDWQLGYLWDDSYPSGGNYWSDYSGLDQFSGPIQNLPGSDGIGDTPYVMDPNNQDRYPLMAPFYLGHSRPPTLNKAELSGTNSQDVTLSWILSPDDGAGLRSVVGYEIHRNMTYDYQGLGYQLIASVPNGTSEFIDTSAGEGNPNNYFYQVCAVDLGGNSTCAERQAGKFTRAVSNGPNLVSIPLIQSDESIERVLQTVKFDKAWTYEAVWNRWISYTTFKPYRGELRTVNHRMGVWVNVTESSNLTVAGIVPWTTSIMMMPGWNLVGFPSFNSDYGVGEMKGVLSVSRVEGFDSSSPLYFLRVLSDSDKLESGYGYWVYSVLSVIWDVYDS